jgi:hypothetical protein
MRHATYQESSQASTYMSFYISFFPLSFGDVMAFLGNKSLVNACSCAESNNALGSYCRTGPDKCFFEVNGTVDGKLVTYTVYCANEQQKQVSKIHIVHDFVS